MARTLQTGQVSSRDVTFAYAPYLDLDTIPTEGWKSLELRTPNSFGDTFTKDERRVFGESRGARKPTITSVTSEVAFLADATVDAFLDFGAAMLYSRPINGDVQYLPATALTGTAITLRDNLKSEQADRFTSGSLVYTTNASAPRVYALTADATASKTLAITGGQAEANDNILVSFCGRRSTAFTGWAYNAVSKTGALTATANEITAIMGLGLTPGQRVYVGSPDSTGKIVNAIGTNNVGGWARVLRIAGTQIVLDSMDAGLKSATGAIGTLDLMFGQFARDVGVTHPDFCEYAFCFEQAAAGLGDGTPGNSSTSYEYSQRNFPNTMEVSIPLQSRAEITFGFSGSDTTEPSTTRQQGADNPAIPVLTEAFSTVADVARLTVLGKDDEGITTDFKSASISFSNNVTPEYVIAQLAAKFQNLGNITATLTAEVLFTSPAPLRAIRDNETVGFSTAVTNPNGTIAIDIPSATMDGGGRSYPENASVTITTNIAAHRDNRFGQASMMISLLAVPIDS